MPRVLELGESSQYTGPHCPANADTAPPELARFAQLDGDLLHRQRPDIVVTPLIGPGFDAHDVLSRLAAADWHGTLRVLAPERSALDMLTEELRGAAATLSALIRIEVERAS